VTVTGTEFTPRGRVPGCAALRVAGIAPETFTPFAFGESRSYLPVAH